EDGIRGFHVTGVQTCALPISVGATGVGAQVTIVFGDGYLGIASAVMTVLILVLSEIVPKTIGARYWRGLAPWLPMVLQALILVRSEERRVGKECRARQWADM